MAGKGTRWRVGAAVVLVAALVTACLPNYADPPAIATSIIGSAPAAGARMIPTSAPIVIRFSGPVVTASVNVTTTPAVALGAPQWIGATGVAFTPAALPANTALTVAVSGNDTAGHAISTTPISFTTAPITAVLATAHPRLS